MDILTARKISNHWLPGIFYTYLFFYFSIFGDIFFIYVSNGIPFPGLPPENPYLIPPSSSLPWQSHTLGQEAFTGSRATPPIGGQPMLYM